MSDKKGERAGKNKKEIRILTEMLAASLQGTPWDGKGVTQAAAEQVYGTADSHAVLSLVAEKFFGYPSLENRAREVCRQTVLRSYHLLFLTRYVVNVLRERGIETVVLKGVSAAFYYREPELRKSGDVDLQLLDPSRIREAENLLLRKGFRKGVQDANHHLSMFSPDGIEVELHIMLAEPFDSAKVNEYLEKLVRGLGDHVQEREIMGVCLPVLTDGLQAFHLLLHMLQHFLRAGFGIKLLCDWVVFWNRDVDEGECRLYRRLTADTGLENFSRMVTSVCVYHLGLQRHRGNRLCGSLFSETEEAYFWRDILESEEFGRGDAERMVVLRDSGLKGYLREFHHQMHLNFPGAGRFFPLFPALWLVTLVRFLRNNRKVRSVSLGQVLKTAKRRSRQMELLGLFRKGQGGGRNAGINERKMTDKKFRDDKAENKKTDNQRANNRKTDNQRANNRKAGDKPVDDKMKKADTQKIDADKIDQRKINIEELLTRGEVIQIHPQGYSMYPMFVPGDEAVIGRADTDKLRRGDVTLYRREKSILVLHRIWAVKPEGFYMMGDNQLEVEGPLRPEQIRGVLLAFIKKGRKISVKNPLYIMLSRLWMLARPLRAIVRKIRQRCRSAGRNGS